MSDKNDNRWLTVAEAAGEFGVSERTLQRRIKSGSVMSKLEKGRRLILASSVAENGEGVSRMASQLSERLADENKELEEQIVKLENELRQQVDRHRQEVAELAEEIRRKDEDLRQERAKAEEARQRQDTIVLQLTRQVEQAQQLAAYWQQPFWRRWWEKRKALGPAQSDK